MIQIRETLTFSRWLESLRDSQARTRIQARIIRLRHGNPGDVKPVGEGVSEMRVDHGPGYRVYFIQKGLELIVLLAGGSKRTQGKGHHSGNRIGEESVGALSMPKTRTRPYDAAAYLKTEADCALYLQAAIDEADGDPSVIVAALGDIARARGMMQLAKETGMTREGLYKSLSPEGNPSFATIIKVCKALGLKLHAESEAYS